MDFNPPLVAKRSPATKVSLQSVLDFREDQALQQQQQHRIEPGTQPKGKSEESKGMDLAIFLGSLKPLQGDTSLKKSARWEKMKEKVARRRPPVVVVEEKNLVPPPLELEQEVEVLPKAPEGHEATTATSAVVNNRIDLEVPSLNFGNEFFQMEETKIESSRSKISEFLERLKREKALSLVSSNAKAEEKSLEVFTAMQALDSASDIHGSNISGGTLKVLIRSFSNLDVIEGSIKVLQETKDFGFLPSTTTHSVLVCLLLKSGEQERAKQMLGEFLLEGSKPSAGIFFTLIDAFERVGNLSAVHILFLGMLQSMVRVNADTTEKFFSILLRAGMAEQTYTLFQEYPITGSDIRVETGNFLMDCLGKAGKHKWSARILSRMRRYRISNVSSYNIMIKNLVKDSELTKSLKVFHMFEADQLSPDVGTYHYIVSGLCKANKTKMAAMYFEGMKKLGLLPDTMTYSTMIDCYGRAGKVNRALQLFEEMKRKNVRLDTRVFNSLLRAVGTSYKPSLVYNIFREMQYFGQVPDIWSYNLLFYGLARRGRRKRLRKVYREMKRDGLKPDIYTYTAIILCLGNAGRTKSAYNFMQGLLRKGVEVNVKTWNALLRGLTKEDVIEVAFSVYNDMKARGFKPDNTTYSLLLENSIALRDAKKVYRIQRDFKDSRLEPDAPMQKILQRSISVPLKQRGFADSQRSIMTHDAATDEQTMKQKKDDIDWPPPARTFSSSSGR
ncbi:pentatricopeptide repeat-containing protein At5g41170, mitochondrial [Selaginella moellendorffii]|uniref:pentatricopeptide repeat-containing protein At5g41170, mitochondrial n=1 Tax=Selaginella moellendorffii TaxID=88036 RepID=UPI000D1C64FE|nr:pentatricopeptide repeat-containing protein At5g41170, mitochondrial [Selaginella moellendorffii]|eukprot:XP_002988670.2 pentatricopeptide repeat-containing protein At5g41170, mitochondrial [Selaginella moellendorffii]